MQIAKSAYLYLQAAKRKKEEGRLTEGDVHV